MGKASAVAEPRPAWSEWKTVRGLPRVAPAVLAETLDGGQSFRWYPLAHGEWIGAWAANLAKLRLGRTGLVEWCAPPAIAEQVEAALDRYLGTAAAFAAATDSLPWRSDPHLAQCLAAFPGLRILRQPFGETLLGFLCSATKQIVQIKQMVALLAERYGRTIAPFAPAEFPTLPRGAFRALPTWDVLAGVPEAKLRECLLGFRARYIAQTAEFLARHPGWLETTEGLPYAEAKERLCSLPGVGEKVADCVLLFGASRLEAFPVDVWILRTLAVRYGLEGWRPAQLTQFGRVHFGANAGLAQQFLFAWERRIGAPRDRSARP